MSYALLKTGFNDRGSQPVFMLENATDGANFLQSIPISEFVSVLIGGGLAFGGTVYSLRRQQSQRNKRLRRALISEIKSIEAGQLHLAVATLRTDEGGSDFLDNFVEDHFDEVTNGLASDLPDEVRDEIFGTEELKKKSMQRVGRMITSINLSTPIWDSNTDKVGNLETGDIEKIIRFYRLLDTCQWHIENAVEAVERESQLDETNDDEDSTPTGDFEHHMWALQNNAQVLAEQKREALEALNADEFIEIEDSYLIYTEDDEDDDEE